ncbi:putative transcriptional regulator [Paenibacillus rhizosphaerae]|uniref:Putative transcriptional regulator n=1 Tax=Paenibacillus rhizosphaerae TaxID=297318 RepID=A0A839TSQ6_9BACL|nr:BlaI/MecI/CopY family transcriptional regulator [Paenibacillus rhizosphaerae]MBB3128690.1 putative transcriptional regulator [Paenibacillus rhizosphaerae]
MEENQIDILSKLLGPLELQVMCIVWEQSEAAVQDVLERLNQEKQYAYTTIMTIMSRLAEKGVLERVKVGRQHKYIPAFTVQEYVERMSSQAIQNVLDDFGDTAIAQFVGKISSNPSKMEQLKSLIERLENGEENEE